MARPPDPSVRLLEGGLCAVLVLAPLPFGAVRPEGRLALEAAAAALLALWTMRALTRGVILPPRGVLAGLGGLLLLGAVQLAPLGPVAGILSPRAVSIRAASVASGDALAAETRLAGAAARSESSPTLSVDPGRTASALRTGTALAALLLVACTVAAERGARGIALALALSAAFQGLYGTLVLASGIGTIWGEAKTTYLDCATGTFVNRNHFAALLAASLPAGVALALSVARRDARTPSGRRGLVEWLGTRGSRAALLTLLVLLGASGLLLSFSRTGTALGIAAIALTVLASRVGGIRARAVVLVLIVSVAIMPLSQLGADRFVERWSDAREALTDEGGRLTVAADTLRLAAAFPLAGAGFGTFGEIYPLFRSPEVRPHYTHAHDDLVQLLAEGGFLSGILLLLVVIPTARRVVEGIGGGFGTVGIGIAAGTAAITLHALVDFVFHIPATAATAAVLAGALNGLPWNDRS